MKLKRVLSTLILSLLTLSLLVGCSKTGNTPSTSTPSETNATVETATPEETTSSDVVTLKWVTVGSGMPTNYDSWKEKLNAYLAEKIGVNIEMEVVPWGDWDNRRNVLVSTGEDFDIIFGHGGNLVPDVTAGYYYDITDLVDANMPNLKALMPDTYWGATTINDSIYAVPTYKDSSLSNYEIWDKALVDEYNLDIEALAESLSAKTEIFTTLKNDKNDYPVYVKDDGLYNLFDVYDQMGAGLQIFGVRYDDQEAKVCFVLEQEDFMANLKTIHEWYNAGIINPDASQLSEGRQYNMWRIAQGWPTAAITVWGPQMGSEVVVAQMGETILSNDTVRGSLNMISANSKNPDKALQFLDLVNTDTWVRDMFYYGEEGVNFEYTSDGKVNKLNEEWTMAGYTQGTFFTVSQNAADEVNQWDEVKGLNEKAVPSVLLGFTFDSSEVADQLTNCTEIWMKYKSEILTGVLDPETAVPEMKAELEAAGWNELVAAAQAQVDAFVGK